jgi:hypothetical protein
MAFHETTRPSWKVFPWTNALAYFDPFFSDEVKKVLKHWLQADSVGLMVYEGSQSLSYVKNFVNGADQWEGKGL